MQTQTFRPASARLVAMGAWLVSGCVAVGAAATADLGVVALAVPASALGALLVWALFWRPEVEVAPGGVTVVNVLRTVHVPWPVLEEAVAGWSLELRTRDRTWTAWAAPRGAAVAELGSGRAGRLAGRLRGGASPASAGVVCAAIRSAQDALAGAGHLDGARATAERAGLRETVTWHRRLIAGALVLLCAVVTAAAA